MNVLKAVVVIVIGTVLAGLTSVLFNLGDTGAFAVGVVYGFIAASIVIGRGWI